MVGELADFAGKKLKPKCVGVTGSRSPQADPGLWTHNKLSPGRSRIVDTQVVPGTGITLITAFVVRLP